MGNRCRATSLTIDQAFAIHSLGPLGETVPAFFQTGSRFESEGDAYTGGNGGTPLPTTTRFSIELDYTF